MVEADKAGGGVKELVPTHMSQELSTQAYFYSVGN